jgi:hypothetical protein
MKTPENEKPEVKPKQVSNKVESPELKKEKKKFENKSEAVKKTVEKKGGASKFIGDNSTGLASGGLFLLGLLTGTFPFMFLGGLLFWNDNKKEKSKG